MKIGYIGNFEPAHSTENHIASTLVSMGHDVMQFQEVGPKAWAADEVRANLESLELLMWTRTPPGLKGNTHAMIAIARGLGIITVAYHLDLYAGLNRAADVGRDAWWTCDYVLTADGGSEDFWEAHGINHHWFPPAVYGAEAYLATQIFDARFERVYMHDVVFTGQRNYHPEWPYRPMLVDWLEKEYGSRFQRFPIHGQPAIRDHALNVLYASTKVVVGDSLVLGFDHKNYWSDRVPETLGRGGFLIMPRIEGLTERFEEDKEIVYYTFNDFDELRYKINYFLTHDAEREAIRKAGHEAALRHSTYRHRMEEMMRLIPAIR